MAQKAKSTFLLRLILRLAVGIAVIACLCLVTARVLGAGVQHGSILVYVAPDYLQHPSQYPVVLVDVGRNLSSKLTLRSMYGGLSSDCSADGHFAFTAIDDSTNVFTAEIYVLDIFSTGKIRATHQLGNNSYLSWSPDGKQLAFVVRHGSEADIFVTDFGGSPPQQLTDGEVIKEAPVWSPDGTQLLFVSQRSLPSEIFTVTVDGQMERRLTHNQILERSPAWSPDGRSIAYAALEQGVLDIYVMDSDGGSVRRFAHTPADDDFPVWSPDGKHLAFVSNYPYYVYIVDADGQNLRMLAGGLLSYSAPIWSPDGQYLAIVAEVTQSRDIYLLNVAGGSYRRLVHTGSTSISAAWCP